MALGLLVFAGNASATTYYPVDGPALNAAVNSANANPGRDRILLDKVDTNNGGVYLPTAPINITDDVTIAKAGRTGSTVPPKIDGGFQVPPGNDRITIAAGVNATLRTMTMTSLGDQTPGQASIRNFGNLRLEQDSIGGNDATSLITMPGSTTTVNNSTFSDNAVTSAVELNGPATFNNVTITRNIGGILDNAPMTLNNTAVVDNPGGDCAVGVATATRRSADSDGMCGVALTTASANLGAIQSNGGPTTTSAPAATSSLVNAGDNTICPTVDQRYFVHADGQCDIGAYEVGAVADTTAPTCVVTALRAGPPKQQDVTAQDGGSGLEPGSSPATNGFAAFTGAYGTPDVGSGSPPSPGAIGGIDNLYINNGTIAFTPFSPFNWTPYTGTHPDRRPLVLTASKTNQTQTTQWSFTAKDIAGNVKHCQ